MNGRGLFPPWALAAAIAVALLAAAGALFLPSGGRPHSDLADAATPGSYSRSAIGHAGVARLLERSGVEVMRRPFETREQLPWGSVLVVAEPRFGAATEATIRRLLGQHTVLLVLPKWTGQPDPDRPGWIDNAELLPGFAAERLLQLASAGSNLVRKPVNAWRRNELGLVPVPVAPVQLAKGGRLRPVVAAEDGILVGEVSRGAKRLWVLSDPDVIANHGIGRDGNAEFALALFSALREPGGKIVFVETLHGSAAETASPLRLLFRPPLVFCTAQAGLALLLLLWAATTRFGAPETPPPALAAGRQRLLRNTAELLEFAGYEAVTVARYVDATIRYVAQQIRAPRGLDGEALIAWLQRVGRARGVSVGCADLAREAEALRTGRRPERGALARLAQDTDRWKREITNGPGEYSRRH